MSIYEYNEEYVRQTLLEDGREEGWSAGKRAGKAEALVCSVDAVVENFSRSHGKPGCTGRNFF